jgi:hypothetical protein
MDTPEKSYYFACKTVSYTPLSYSAQKVKNGKLMGKLK